MVSILPFHLSWNISTFISSQFVSCIESLKKIVKKKTRTQVCNSATWVRQLRAFPADRDARSSFTHIVDHFTHASHPHEHWRFRTRKIYANSAQRAQADVKRRTVTLSASFATAKKISL